MDSVKRPRGSSKGSPVPEATETARGKCRLGGYNSERTQRKGARFSIGILGGTQSTPKETVSSSPIETLGKVSFLINPLVGWIYLKDALRH